MELVKLLELNLRLIDGSCAQRVQSDVAVCKELSELLGKADFVVWLNRIHLYGVPSPPLRAGGQAHNVIVVPVQARAGGFNAGDVVWPFQTAW